MYALSLPKKARGDHSRVVVDHQLVALEQLRQLLKQPILKLATRPVEQEHARRVAPFQWALCNELRWQLVVKLFNPHGRECNSEC
jgi:hypothetical protein